MPKYVILYNATVAASDLMASSTPEEMQAGMDAWMEWRDEAVKSVKFDFGMPLQAVTRITSEGARESDNPASGYSIMEGDSEEEIIELLQSHPHMHREGASIDVLEMLSMPGI